jgi:hypothetical protein
MCTHIFIDAYAYDEKFGYIDIEKGPETIISPGIYIHI